MTAIHTLLSKLMQYPSTNFKMVARNPHTPFQMTPIHTLFQNECYPRTLLSQWLLSTFYTLLSKWMQYPSTTLKMVARNPHTSFQMTAFHVLSFQNGCYQQAELLSRRVISPHYSFHNDCYPCTPFKMDTIHTAFQNGCYQKTILSQWLLSMQFFQKEWYLVKMTARLVHLF